VLPPERRHERAHACLPGFKVLRRSPAAAGLSQGRLVVEKPHRWGKSHSSLIQVGLRIASNLPFAGFPRIPKARVTLAQRAKNPLLS
jgi:hypothetical protein